jgi:hypothetical protein
MGTRLKPLEDAVQKSAVGDAKVAAPADMIHPDHAATHAHPLRTRLVPAKPSSFQLFSFYLLCLPGRVTLKSRKKIPALCKFCPQFRPPKIRP